MKKENVNIYDIAKMTGVSIATVSRVLNNSDKVSEKTRMRVMSVINEVGYEPNVFAQGLGLNTMHTVGILVPDISDIYMSSAVAYLENALAEYQYHCLLGCSGFTPEGKRAHTRMLLSKHIDALILVGSTYAGTGKDKAETDYIREAAKQVPVFVINGIVEGDNIYSAAAEDEAAEFGTAQMLIKKGYKDIIFLTDSHSYSSVMKRTGYEQAMKSNALKPRHYYVENSIEGVKKFLVDNPDIIFNAVVAANDTIGVGVVKYALEKGLNIPKDLAVVGYNNSFLANACAPELSSVDNHREKICYDTVQNLMCRLGTEGENAKRRFSVSCELIERGTT